MSYQVTSNLELIFLRIAQGWLSSPKLKKNIGMCILMPLEVTVYTPIARSSNLGQIGLCHASGEMLLHVIT